MASSLPLRLRAEPIVKESFKSYNLFVLPSKYEEKLCLIVSNIAQGGMFALVSDILYKFDEIIEILELSSSDISPFIYVLSENAWYVYDKSNTFSMVRINSINELKEKMNSSAYAFDTNIRGCNKVIEGINRYYSRQVLEPAIRGFLSILEKQFPRNDLYLFELLQNAVDDGAMHVIFKSISRGNVSNNKDAEGLMFLHNGRPFNSLDCLGLSSVGLSSKTGEKRTIGFMGIGFKSVYKRFARVVIYDEKWKFMFEDPKQATPRGGGYITNANSSNSNIPNSMEPTHAYVLKPMYVDNFSKLWGTQADKEWCHFQLELPVGGISSVYNDLKYLPFSIPPLLGRQAIYNKYASNSGAVPTSSPLEWALEWENTKYTVTRIDNSSCNISFTSGLMRDNHHGSNSGSHWDLSYDSFKINMQTKMQQRGGDNKFFLFLSVKYVPNSKAQETFAAHTKKPWIGTGGTNKEETSFFFELNPNDLTSPKDTIGSHHRGSKEERFGHVHAVLPTKLKLPTAINWQASWLLSVDRQEVQDIVSNDWNNNILCQASRLYASLLIWTSKSQFTPASCHKLALIYNLFPPLLLEQNKLICWMLNQKVDMDLLTTVVKHEPVVPIHSGSPSQEIVFKPANMTIWLPPTIVAGIPHSILIKWFNSCPMATNFLSTEMVFSKLWECVPRPTKASLTTVANRFSLAATESVTNMAVLIIQILAAFGATSALKVPVVSPNPTENATSAATNTSTGSANASGSDIVSSDILCDSMIAPLSSWPILYTDAGDACFIYDIALCSEDFATVPKNIRYILRKGVSLACDNQQKNPGRKSKLLHSEVEDILFGDTSTALPSDVSINAIASAKLCLNIFRDNFPSRVVTVEQAAHHLFKHIASSGKNGIIDDEVHLNLVVELFKYSLLNNRPGLMTHLLVDINQQRKLIPSHEAYSSSELLLNIRGNDNKILFVSQILVSVDIPGPRNRINASTVTEFLRRCGASTTISIMAVSREPSKDDISKLAGGILPKVRTSNTSCNVFLPYGLGLINRKKHYVLDFQFALEWKHIIRSIGKDIAKATSMVLLVTDLLKALECDSVITADSMPAAAECIKAKVVDEASSVHSNNRLNISSGISGFKRLLYLPPGQPGASLTNIDIAEWMSTLANSNWVPCYPPGHVPVSNEAPTLVLKPCEAILCAPSPNTNTSMPTASIPVNVLKYYQNAPKIVQDAFRWGTVKPAPPIDRLGEIISDPRDIDPDTFYSELIYVWKEIGLALQESRLSAVDIKIIKSNLASTKKSIIPYNFKLYPIQRAVSIDFNQCAADENCEVQATLMLHKLGFVVNIHDSSACYDHEQQDLWELRAVLPSLISLFQLPRTVTAAVAEDYLNCWNGKMSDSVGQPDNYAKKAFSYALWIYLKPFIGRGCNSSLLPEDVAQKCAATLEKRFPTLQIYCKKGPNFGHNVFPARYLDIFPRSSSDTTKLRVRPVLIDDGGDRMTTSGSGITRSSLLKVEHKLQPVTMLSSSVTDKSNSTLVDIDNKLLQILEIPRTSDTKAFVLKVATTGSPVRLTESSQLLEIVILLCQLLIDGSNNVDNAVATRANSTPPVPNIVKHGSINIHFKAPTMVETAMKPSYCVWGAPEKNKTSDDSVSKSKVIYISGNADDYGTELEELVYSYVVDSMSKSNYINRSTINRPFRALRLLNYIEDSQSFLKRLKRDFDSFFMPNNEARNDDSVDVVDDSVRLLELIGNLNKKLMQAEMSDSKKRAYEEVATNNTVSESNNDTEYEPSAAKQRMSSSPAAGDCITVAARVTDQPPSLVQQRVSNLPAWMTSGDLGAAAVDSSHDTKSSMADNVPNIAPASLVQQRVSNLPAWMTSGDLGAAAADSSYDTASSMADNAHNVAPASLVQQRVSNLPAWMTSNNLGPVVPSNESNQKVAQDFLSTLSIDVINTLEFQENENKKRRIIEDGEVPSEGRVASKTNPQISAALENVQIELNELICGYCSHSQVSSKLSQLLHIVLTSSNVMFSEGDESNRLKEIIKFLIKEGKHGHKYNNLYTFCS